MSSESVNGLQPETVAWPVTELMVLREGVACDRGNGWQAETIQFNSIQFYSYSGK